MVVASRSLCGARTQLTVKLTVLMPPRGRSV